MKRNIGNTIQSINRIWIKIALLTGGIFLGCVFLIPLSILAPIITPLEVFWMIGIFLVYLGCVVFAWSQINNLVGSFWSLIPLIFAWLVVNELIIKRDWFNLIFLNILGWILIIYFTLTLIPIFVNLIGILIKFGLKIYHEKVERASFFKQIRATKVSLFISLIILLSGSGLLIGSWVIRAGETILIQPQDYQAKLAFWGCLNHSRYDSNQLDALNRTKVTIATYDVGDLRVPAVQEWFVNETKWWRDNYSEVQFLPAIRGVPGGFVWDGSALGTTEMAKVVVELIHSETLSNVKGLSFDWESPREDELYGMSDIPNATRHAEAVQIWNEFFDWMDENAPELILSNINYIEMGVDLWDNDFDLHVQERFLTYEVPRWDEYAPMIYRCGYRFTKPYGDFPIYPSGKVDTTYQFYEQVKCHIDAVNKVHGDTQRAGIYIGITNCTCYGRDVHVTEFGEYLGTGYDVLVRDALICKSFRIPTITIFILTTEFENGYSMGGVFESYGDAFLDNFNASINGPQSTQPFTIPVDPAYLDPNFIPERIKPYLKDLLFNLNHPVEFMVIWVMILSGGSIAVIWDFKQVKKARVHIIN